VWRGHGGWFAILYRELRCYLYGIVNDLLEEGGVECDLGMGLVGFEKCVWLEDNTLV
jgi:hypothetical protein